MSPPPLIVIIGGGPAGLMTAEVIAKEGYRVQVFDQMPSVGRKFLMAGRGGLNLTHSEPIGSFLARYKPLPQQLLKAVRTFQPKDLIEWCHSLDQTTFVGSSGRIFPTRLKASPLLRAWLKRLKDLRVEILTSHKWIGWDKKDQLIFETADKKKISVKADATILALGGASWPKLGSDGAWVDYLRAKNIDLAPLYPANCGFISLWSDIFRKRFEGQPLKPVTVSFDEETIQGEIMITQKGLEGGAVYALSRPLREAILSKGHAIMKIDLRPGLTHKDLMKRFQISRGSQSLSTYLTKALGLSKPAIGLIQEILQSKKTANPDEKQLVDLIKALPLRLTATYPIDRAISTAGGIRFDALDQNFMVKKEPGLFAVGEMLDWEAPTGGYLLQASFSTAVAAAHGVIYWLKKNR